MYAHTRRSSGFRSWLVFIGLMLPVLLLSPLTIPVQAQGSLFERINGLRASLGLAPYSLNGALGAAAQGHAQWMAETGTISHTGPGGSTPRSRAAAAGYPSSWVSENIYGGTLATSNDAWNFWINSPIHYAGLTNTNYTDIGIGTASSAWGTTFVLVFGNGNAVSGGGGNSNNSGGGNTGGNAVAAAPSFIVGWDAVGNIMHEIQPGETIGDIALIYGYTWADIPYMLEINAMTQEDIRLLPEGGVFLVPPQAGTYTPSPLPPGVTLTATPEPITGTPGDGEPTLTPTIDLTKLIDQLYTGQTAQAIQTQTEAAAQSAPGTPPAPTNAAGPVVPPRIATSATIPVDLPETVTAEVPLTLTPTPEDAPPVTAVAMAQNGTPVVTGGSVVIIRDDPSTPILLVAVVVQSLIILAAGFEFVRRLRRK